MDCWEDKMDFGYFTLSDNHYDNNTRSSNQFVADITAEALYADKLGMHSAWIGEHHFNSLGVLSCPDMVLTYVAANTTRIRLAPAVTVLPLHHPIRVAEQWATLDLLSGGRVDFACGRGYDKREYLPFHVSFEDNQGIFEEGLELVRKLWSAEGRISHHGKHYSFDAEPAADLCRLVLETLDRACRAPRMRADRRAVRRGDELWRLEAGRRPLS
jgi:alkanesulfonate monooxygenase SsuD/methylene tetrahydromethanopterin reductase-like flavin-dependent oxidoreductase (luciferase family)